MSKEVQIFTKATSLYFVTCYSLFPLILIHFSFQISMAYTQPLLDISSTHQLALLRQNRSQDLKYSNTEIS